MEQHIGSKRLLEVAEKEIRLTQPEFDHLENCIECQMLYMESILRVALVRAEDKRKKAPSLSI